MENTTLWFIGKEHWLVILGILLAILGAFYNAYGLDKERKFFGTLTQGLSFGLVGAFFIGLGLGLIGIFLVALSNFLFFLQENLDPLAFYPSGFFQTSFSTDLLIVSSFAAIGIILGIIGGFLIGFQASGGGKRIFPLKWSLLFKLVFIEMILLLSIMIQVSFTNIEYFSPLLVPLFS